MMVFHKLSLIKSLMSWVKLKSYTYTWIIRLPDPSDPGQLLLVWLNLFDTLQPSAVATDIAVSIHMMCF